jgi:hypothetical protein
MERMAEPSERKAQTLGISQRWAVALVVLSAMLGWSWPAYGVELTVECSNPKARLKSINQVLAFLPKQGPNTIHVSGVCNESVIIDGFDNLTLVADPGASINDPTPSVPDDNDVLDISNSERITVQGFTVNGGIDGIACFQFSICFLNNNTVQGASDAGVVIGRGTLADLTGNIIQSNGGNGLDARNGANATVIGGTITSNGGAGAFANNQSLLRFLNDGSSPVIVQNNGFDGVFATENSTITLGFNGAAITGNNGTGLTVEHASVGRVGEQNQITGNAAAGVGLGESSFAFVGGSANVSGNTAGDVVCVGTFSNAVAVGPNAGLSCHNP